METPIDIDDSWKEEKEVERLPKRYVPCFTAGKKIFESIIFQGRPVFLSWDDKEFWRFSDVEQLDERLLPLTKEMFPYRPYALDQEIFKKIQTWNPTRQQIFNKIYREFDRFLDLEPEYKALNTIATLETYEQHKISALSYLFLRGDNESGKTQALEVHNHLDYRPLFSSALPPADVYNFIGYHEEGTGTIIEDEADSLNRERDIEKLKIYRSGYRKGATAPRIVEPSSKKRTQRFYKTFCSKIFAGLYLPKDRGFKQRCIEVPMVWGIPERDEITEEDRKRMDMIKLGLLVWRMKHYWNSLPEMQMQLQGRIKELWKSKAQIVSGLEQERYVKDLAFRHAREKARERAQSLEAYITRALLSLRATDETELPFSIIWFGLLEDLGVPIEEREKEAVDCPALGYKLSKKAVGGRLRSVFSGQAFLRHEKGRTWRFKKDRLERLDKKFFINGINRLNGKIEIKEGVP